METFTLFMSAANTPGDTEGAMRVRFFLCPYACVPLYVYVPVVCSDT